MSKCVLCNGSGEFFYYKGEGRVAVYSVEAGMPPLEELPITCKTDCLCRMTLSDREALLGLRQGETSS